MFCEFVLDLLPSRTEILDRRIIDAGDFKHAVLADAVDRIPNLLELMRQRRVIRRTGRHLEVADDFRMKSADTTIALTCRDVQADAMRMQIRISEHAPVAVPSFSAFTVLEGRPGQGYGF